MRKSKDPITVLKSLFPWPAERPNVPLRRERWFNTKKQVLLRRTVPTDVKLVIELGSWLGDSTRWFLDHCPEATVVAVDTWLGSCEHLMKKRRLLPVLHETFLANCWEYQNRLIPFRNTSLAALNFLNGLGLKPDAIYFDSDHSHHGLVAELETAQLFFPEAVFVGDDYTGGTIAQTIEEFTNAFSHYKPDRNRMVWRGWKVEHLHDSWHIVREAE